MSKCLLQMSDYCMGVCFISLATLKHYMSVLSHFMIVFAHSNLITLKLLFRTSSLHPAVVHKSPGYPWATGEILWQNENISNGSIRDGPAEFVIDNYNVTKPKFSYITVLYKMYLWNDILVIFLAVFLLCISHWFCFRWTISVSLVPTMYLPTRDQGDTM